MAGWSPSDICNSQNETRTHATRKFVLPSSCHFTVHRTKFGLTLLESPNRFAFNRSGFYFYLKDKTSEWSMHRLHLHLKLAVFQGGIFWSSSKSPTLSQLVTYSGNLFGNEIVLEMKSQTLSWILWWLPITIQLCQLESLPIGRMNYFWYLMSGRPFRISNFWERYFPGPEMLPRSVNTVDRSLYW